VLQEIFGVNAPIGRVADSFAALGYLAIAPALFDRVERGEELGYDPGDFDRARTLRGQALDEHIPLSDVDRIRSSHSEMAVCTDPADRGFNCDTQASYDAPSAALALERTLRFLGEKPG
jgi:dienelactone hydrolase